MSRGRAAIGGPTALHVHFCSLSNNSKKHDDSIPCKAMWKIYRYNSAFTILLNEHAPLKTKILTQ